MTPKIDLHMQSQTLVDVCMRGNLREERDHLSTPSFLCHHTPSLRETGVGTLGFLLACFLAQHQLGFLYSLGPLAYCGTAYNDCALPHQLTIKKCPNNMSTDQSEGNSSAGVLSSQVTLGCIKLTIKTSQDKRQPPNNLGIVL